MLQAGGRLLRTNAVNDASFASIAGLDKVCVCAEHVGGERGAGAAGARGFASASWCRRRKPSPLSTRRLPE